MDLEYDVVGGYIPSFVQHLKDTGARLGSRIGSQADEGQIDAGDAAKEDSQAEAHAFSGWTPAEHDAFFRAISVHSRWRPDLIAACVPSKTEWEVWTYLEALEEGGATLATQQGDDDANMDVEDGLVDERPDVAMQVDSDGRSQGAGSEADEDEDEDKELCEPALEVSQDWVDAEERMAAWIIDEEHRAAVENDADADAAEVEEKPPKRKRGRRRGASKGRAQSKVRRQKVSNTPPPDHRSPSPERKRSRDPSIVPASKREALMSRLEVPHLLVLDSILRVDEEGMKDKSKSREGSVTTALLTEHGDEGPPDARESSLSDRITGPSGTSNVPESSSNAVIDPVLLALSGVADPTGRQSGQGGSEGTTTNCVPVPAPAQGSSSLLDASSQLASLEESAQARTSNMFTLPQDNGTLTNPDATANAEESDLSLFSPRSRRRIQKRLYMRRKRAILVENGAVAVDTGIGKLKPGKKSKSARSETPVVSTSVPCSEAPSDAEAELPQNVRKKNKPGLTLPYKLKAQFAKLGIDAAYIRSQGMDLLNLGALGKLMGLYSSLEHREEEADGTAIAASIDAQLIQHLQAAMVSFVTDLIHRAIVWREREIRLKQRSRVWRQGDQITVGAVEHAAEAIGARYHSHKAYLKSLEAFHGQTAEVPNTSVDADVGAAEPAVLSPHREVYTPLIHPPSAWRTRPLGCLSRTYEREATRTRRGTSADMDEDELMGDETEDEALEAELAEEDEADERDMGLGARQERDLWEAVGRLDN